jgi:hypothetical protein
VGKGPIRFAVGHPQGLTSNSSKCWASKQADVYIVCRDNFTEAKVSLHASGEWRMGFTQEAVRKCPGLLPKGRNRAWRIWRRPPPQIPDTVIAFRLLFPTSELAVRLEQRATEVWKKNVIYIEAAPPDSGLMAAATLFVTGANVNLRPGSGKNFSLAALDIGQGSRAQFIAHQETEDVLDKVQGAIEETRGRVIRAGVEIPPGAYSYMVGECTDGVRYLVGGRVNR